MELMHMTVYVNQGGWALIVSILSMIASVSDTHKYYWLIAHAMVVVTYIYAGD